jgi:serine/threonine-protein kinase
MNPRRAVELCAQIADALADGHSAGILHGDLRPETVVVTGKGSAKLLDFGMWRWTRGGLVRRAAGRAPDSRPGEDTAIAAYMAPEQALGGRMDGRADVFSLGTILYEMLTGRNPFIAPSVPDTVMNIVQAAPRLPSVLIDAVPAELDTIIARALAKDLEKRYQSAASLSADLRSAALAFSVRSDDRSPEYLLTVDDEADKVPMGVWIAGFTGVAALVALTWWVLR